MNFSCIELYEERNEIIKHLPTLIFSRKCHSIETQIQRSFYISDVFQHSKTMITTLIKEKQLRFLIFGSIQTRLENGTWHYTKHFHFYLSTIFHI